MTSPSAGPDAGKMLVVTNDFPPRRGGIETFVFSLCQSLPSSRVVVYTAHMRGDADFDASLLYPVVRDRSRILLPTWRVARRARALAREHGCDRVMFGAAAPLGLLARGLRGAGVRRLIGLTHGHEVWWSRAPVARRLLRRIGDDVDVLTYVSEYCRREISPALSATAAGRMVQLSPGVDTARFGPVVDGSPWRERWGAGGRPVVLAASRLVARKGHDVLIKAWPEVLRACPAALLVVMGDGPMRRRLERAALRTAVSDSVRVVAGVPWHDMPGVYAAADVFALPCRTRLHGLEPEAFGLVFLEAAASGLPVVAGRSGGVPEALVHGETGYLVDPGDVELVAQRISALLTAPATAHAMGSLGRQWVRENHSPQDAQGVAGCLPASRCSAPTAGFRRGEVGLDET
jgi:phosphatidylinositol alpha-1,6-mannosyltransferase